MKYYITQYIETRGILVVDTEKDHIDSVEVTRNGDLKCHGKFDFNRTPHYWIIDKDNWFLTYSEALADAQLKKTQRIAKVTAQLERLNALTFPDFPAEERSTAS